MPKTKHFLSRIQQRGILESSIEVAQRYGFPKGDKYILGKKQIDIAIKTLDQERRALLKARDALKTSGAFLANNSPNFIVLTVSP
mgnify:CR=1 FL=1